MWLKFYTLEEELEAIEALLYELATLEDELRYMGLRYTLRRLDLDKARPAFEGFSGKIADCRRAAPLISKELASQLTSLLDETKIDNLITQLAVRLKLAEMERPKQFRSVLASYTYMIGRLIGKSQSAQLFADTTIHIDTVLASLARLKTVTKLLRLEYQRITSDDDEIFKPSNVNIEIVVNQIDLAIDNLQNVTNISPAEKERLIIYLKEAKTELASDTPKWKKIIGALIICATLLSGLADAPQAIDNLNAAITHILGTSVEKALPTLLPAPKLDNSETCKALGTGFEATFT